MLARDSADLYLAKAARYHEGLDASPPSIGRDLLLVLGCPYRLNRADRYRVSLDIAADAAACLPDILRASVSATPDDNEWTALLFAIGRAKCWDACAATLDGAYTLAVALVRYIELFSLNSLLDGFVEQDVLKVLNGWLKHDPYSDFPNSYMLCERLFGDLWCSLALPASAKNRPGSDDGVEEFVCKIIYTQRPPFLPGLCPAQYAQESAPLPDNVGPTQ